MSRNFVGSSYHGSNDYKKFRQERLKKNGNQNYANNQIPKQANNLYEFNPKSTSNFNTDKTSYAKEQFDKSINKNKWNNQVQNPYKAEGKNQKLHTFNKNDFKDSYSYGRQEDEERTRYIKLQNNYQSNQNPKNLNQRYSISSTNRLKFNHQNQYDKPREPLNVQNKWQQRSFKKDSRESQTYRGNKYETNRQNQEVVQHDKQKSFQDQVILRSLRYQYGNKSLKQSSQRLQKVDYPKDLQEQNGRTFRYTQKLANSFANRNFGQDSAQNTQKSHSTALNQISNEYFRNKNINEPKFTQKISKNSYESKLNDQQGSYRYRNQIIKQRMSINNQPSSNTTIPSSLKQKNPNLSQIGHSNPYQSKYKTNQVTPQKSYNLNTDRQLSEQRRKSLIQKSQILKQKLNRLNVSNNKKESIQQKSKIYTPNKQSDRGNQEKSILVTKRLNFNEDIQSDRSSKLRSIKSSNITKNKEAEPIRTTFEFKQINKQNENLPSNSKQFSKQDPLKKISQLNEKINDRLQSILRNYG